MCIRDRSMIQEDHLPSLYISHAARAQAVTHSSAQEYMRICTAYSMAQGIQPRNIRKRTVSYTHLDIAALCPNEVLVEE